MVRHSGTGPLTHLSSLTTHSLHSASSALCCLLARGTYSGIIRNPKLFSKRAFMACMMAVLRSRLHEVKMTKVRT